MSTPVASGPLDSAVVESQSSEFATKGIGSSAESDLVVAVKRYFYSPDFGDPPLLTRRQKQARKGLPKHENLLKLARVWLSLARKLWPELAGSLPPETDAAVEALCVAFRDRFVSGTLDAFHWDGPRQPWKALACVYLRYSSDNSNPRSLDDQLDKAMKRARDDKGWAPKRRYSIEEAAKQYCTYLAEYGRHPMTVKGYERLFRELVTWGSQHSVYNLNDLTATNLVAFQRALRETGVYAPKVGLSDGIDKRRIGGGGRPNGPKTVRDKMKTVRSLIRYALGPGEMLEHNPAPAYKLPPRVAEKNIKAYTPDQLTKIFSGPTPELADIWRFMVETCLRASELTWLTKEDIVPDEHGNPFSLLIRPKNCPQSGKAWRPKRNRTREVALTPQAVEILNRQLRRSSVPWVFEAPGTCGEQKGKWRKRRLLRILQEHLKKLGLEHGVLHMFRHTGASMFASRAQCFAAASSRLARLRRAVTSPVAI